MPVGAYCFRVFDYGHCSSLFVFSVADERVRSSNGFLKSLTWAERAACAGPGDELEGLISPVRQAQALERLNAQDDHRGDRGHENQRSDRASAV